MGHLGSLSFVTGPLTWLGKFLQKKTFTVLQFLVLVDNSFFLSEANNVRQSGGSFLKELIF